MRVVRQPVAHAKHVAVRGRLARGTTGERDGGRRCQALHDRAARCESLVHSHLPTIIARMCLPKPVSTTIATCPTTNEIIATKPKKCSVRADWWPPKTSSRTGN